MEEDHIVFGKLLKAYRIEKGWTQENVARDVLGDEAQKGRISKYENGKIPGITQATVAALAMALDIPTNDVPITLRGVLVRQRSRDPKSALSSENETSPILFPPDPGMIGRNNEHENLLSAILGHEPVVIVSGGPGFGKTTLAISACNSEGILDHFQDRRYFLRLDGVKNGHGIAASLANEIGLTVSGRTIEILKAVKSSVKSPTLVVLDNFETPWHNDASGSEDIVRYLGSSNIKIVVTVRGRTPPVGYCIPELEAISEVDTAKGVFLLYSGTKRKENATDPNLERLVSILDGHPLSLKLMGAASQSFADLPSLISCWEEERAKLLREGPTETPLTSTRASLGASLSSPAIAETAKRLLSQIALVPYGARRKDAKSLIAEDGDFAARELLAHQLIDERNGKLTMLAPLREAAILDLPASDSDRLALVDFYLPIARSAGEAGREKWQEVERRVLEEASNLDTVCELALACDDPLKAFDAMRGLARFHRFTSLGAVHSLKSAIDIYDQLDRPLEAGHCAMSLAAVHTRRRDFNKGKEFCSVAMHYFERANSVMGQANCHQAMARLFLDNGDISKARRLYFTALRMYLSVDGELGSVNCVRGLADICRKTQRYPKSLKLYEECRDFYSNRTDKLGSAISQQSIGSLYFQMGRIDEAEEILVPLVDDFKDLTDPLRVAKCFNTIGDIHGQRDNLQKAIHYYKKALYYYEKIGYSIELGKLYIKLAVIVSDRLESDKFYEAAKRALGDAGRLDLMDLDAGMD